MKKIYIIAILTALITGIAVYTFASSLEKEDVVAPIAITSVVIANIDIQANTYITPEMVSIIEVPIEYAHIFAVKTLDEVVHKISRSSIYSQEQILSVKIEALGEESAKLSYVVPTGYLATSVDVDDVIGVSGFVEAGDFVDIVVTYEVSKIDGGDTFPVSIFIVQRVEVLRIDLKSAVDSDDQKVIYESVTIAIKPDDLLAVHHAETNGIIRLALRGALDETIYETQEYVSPWDIDLIKAVNDYDSNQEDVVIP